MVWNVMTIIYVKLNICKSKLLISACCLSETIEKKTKSSYNLYTDHFTDKNLIH